MAINGLVVMTPTSIAYSGTSASINADGSISFTSITSLSLNGVFTGDYENYMITARVHGGTFNMLARLRSGGADDSSSSYNNAILHGNGTTVQGAAYYNAPLFYFGDSGGVYRDGYTGYFFGPYLAQPTAMRSIGARSNSGAYISHYGNTNTTSNSYDGITTYPSTGSATGLLTVFGFNQ